jgi:hypothetical protein
MWQWFFFWLMIGFACAAVIGVNGGEFVRQPHLHQD